MEPLRLYRDMRRQMTGRSEQEIAEAVLTRLEAIESFDAIGVPTQEDLERWWQLVTDPDHVASELSQIPKAWAGAIKSRQEME